MTEFVEPLTEDEYWLCPDALVTLLRFQIYSKERLRDLEAS